MLVAAPGLLSTMNGWPVRSDSHWPIRRAMMSLPPAGAKPTTQRTGRFGQTLCAANRLGRRGSGAAARGRVALPSLGKLPEDDQATLRRDVGTLYAVFGTLSAALAKCPIRAPCGLPFPAF